MIKHDVSEPSDSPWTSPVLVVKKPGAAPRFCGDFRKLNNITEKDSFPLPRIEDILSSVGDAQYYSTMDLLAGYGQIPVHPEDKPKLAFVTPDGLFQFKVMPFGPTNAPSVFQRHMQVVLGGLKWQNRLVYIDDIIIFSKTFEKHLDDIDSVFSRMRKYNMKVKLKKCHFCQEETHY